MPDAFAGGLQEVVHPALKIPATLLPPALVARSQGGLTLGLEQGEFDVNFHHLGLRRP